MPRWFDFANKVSCHSQHFCELYPLCPPRPWYSPCSQSGLHLLLLWHPLRLPIRPPQSPPQSLWLIRWQLPIVDFRQRLIMPQFSKCYSDLPPPSPPDFPWQSRQYFYLRSSYMWRHRAAAWQEEEQQQGSNSMGCCAIWVSLIGRCPKVANSLFALHQFWWPVGLV